MVWQAARSPPVVFTVAPDPAHRMARTGGLNAGEVSERRRGGIDLDRPRVHRRNAGRSGRGRFNRASERRHRGSRVWRRSADVQRDVPRDAEFGRLDRRSVLAQRAGTRRNPCRRLLGRKWLARSERRYPHVLFRERSLAGRTSSGRHVLLAGELRQPADTCLQLHHPGWRAHPASCPFGERGKGTCPQVDRGQHPPGASETDSRLHRSHLKAGRLRRDLARFAFPMGGCHAR